MNANELRIGNWALHRGKYVQVNANTILAIVNGSKHYAPIELSPEILEQVGFEQQPMIDLMTGETTGKTDHFVLDLSIESDLRIHLNFAGGKVYQAGCDRGELAVNIKTIDQLQNFIYFTFNTELQWNRKQ